MATKNSTYLKLTLKILPWVVIAAVGYFFAQTLLRNWNNLSGVSLELNLASLLSIVCFTLAVVVSGLLWGRLVIRLSGVRVSNSDSIRIHCASWLLKYVPGQVGSLINKLLWGEKQSISKKTITSSFLYENILLVLASLVLSLPVLALFSQELGSDLSLFLPLLLALPLLLLIFNGKVFYRLLGVVLKRLGRQPFAHSDILSSKVLISYFIGYLIPRFLNGIGFVLLAGTIVAVTPDMYAGLIAIYALAGVIGLLAIFVPSGIGVREAIIVLLASAYFPVEQAIVLSLVARLYATIADIGVAGVYLLLNKGHLKQQ